MFSILSEITDTGTFEMEANGRKSIIVIFPKRETFDRDFRKFWVENEIERKSPVRNCRKFGH